MAKIDKGTPEPQPSFEEQMRQAEADAGVPPDSEVYAEWGVENPEPDEAGRVPASRPADEPAEAEAVPAQEEVPVEAEEPAQEPAEPEETPEPAPDLAVQQAELSKKLGDLLNDNADLRRQNEALLAQSQQAPSEAQFVQPLTDVGWFDEMAESDPANAATWALQNQQTHLYDRAVRAWYEQDPVAAGRYERQVENAMLLQNINQSVQPQVQAANDLAARARLENGMAAVAARHDDFGDVMGTMTPETVKKMIAAGLPTAILEQGLAGDQAQVEGAFETLYRFQKADVAGHLVKAAQETPARIDEEAREAKREAFVGSAATTTPDEVPVTEAERMMQAWASQSRSLRDGWEGKESRGRGR